MKMSWTLGRIKQIIETWLALHLCMVSPLRGLKVQRSSSLAAISILDCMVQASLE